MRIPGSTAQLSNAVFYSLDLVGLAFDKNTNVLGHIQANDAKHPGAGHQLTARVGFVKHHWGAMHVGCRSATLLLDLLCVLGLNAQALNQILRAAQLPRCNALKVTRRVSCMPLARSHQLGMLSLDCTASYTSQTYHNWRT